MPIDPTDIVKSAKEVVSSNAVAGSLTDAWQAILGDYIATWRLTNAAKTQVKAQKKFKELGLRPNIDRIPERYAITWFEEASKQDEDEIQELFARLLARAAAGNEDALDRRNLEIVSNSPRMTRSCSESLLKVGGAHGRLPIHIGGTRGAVSSASGPQKSISRASDALLSTSSPSASLLD